MFLGKSISSSSLNLTSPSSPLSSTVSPNKSSGSSPRSRFLVPHVLTGRVNWETYPKSSPRKDTQRPFFDPILPSPTIKLVIPSSSASSSPDTSKTENSGKGCEEIYDISASTSSSSLSTTLSLPDSTPTSSCISTDSLLTPSSAISELFSPNEIARHPSSMNNQLQFTHTMSTRNRRNTNTNVRFVPSSPLTPIVLKPKRDIYQFRSYSSRLGDQLPQRNRGFFSKHV